MVMDDEWNDEYGVVAKIKKPNKFRAAYGVNPRQLANMKPLNFFIDISTLYPPPYLHLVSVNTIEQVLYNFIKKSKQQVFELLDKDNIITQLTNSSNSFFYRK
ncbi:unnamed protein product [Cunninghamella blakesleeana]